MSQPKFKQHSILWQADGYYGDWAADHLDSDGALSAFHSAHQKAAGTAKRLLEARDASLRNKYQTEAQNLRTFHAQHQRAVESNLKAIDDDLQRARGEIDAIESRLAAPIEANSKNAHEIRAHLKGLTPKERQAVIADALANGDQETVTSVLAAPAYLSGLNKPEAAHYEHEFRRRTYPDEFARLERLKKAEQLATDAGQELVKLSSEIHQHDVSILADAEASERAAKEALDGLKW